MDKVSKAIDDADAYVMRLCAPERMTQEESVQHDAYVKARRVSEKDDDAEYHREQERAAELSRRGAANW